MSKANSPVLRGLSSEAIQFLTITTHDWGDTSEWPAVDNSKYIIQPDNGKAMVLSGVLVKFSEAAAMIADNAMIIEGIIADGVPAIELIRFKKIRDYLKRADEYERMVFESDSGGDFTASIVVLKLDFSDHIFLWSSAGLTGSPPQPKVDKLGIPKFRKMQVRMESNLPIKNKADGLLEIATSRYFAAVYVDPDYGV